LLCSGSLGSLTNWDNSCECVSMEYDGCLPNDEPETGCPFYSSNPNDNTAILPIAFPDSIQCVFQPMGGGEFSLVCLEPGDSCLFGNSKEVVNEWTGYIYPVPDIINHSDSTTVPFYPIEILESSFTNFPYDWLIVNYFNSVVDENCECECVSGNYLYVDLDPNMYPPQWNPWSTNTIPLQQFYYDCNPIDTYLDENLCDKKLITTVDILGRETTNKGFQLHIYDDGSVEKKYVIK